MKKVFKVFALSLLAAGFMTGAASAQTSVSNTGPGSNVSVGSSQTCTVTVNNNTSIGVVSNNNQGATSGGASSSGNTSGGSSSSGNASNNSSVTGGFTVINSAPVTSGSGNNCPPVAAAPVTPTPVNPTTPTPVQPSGGSGAVLGSRTVAAASTIAALPNTGANGTVSIITASVLALGSVAAISKIGVIAYKNSL